MSRDWTASLFPASFNGVAFWVKLDAAETGRRLKIDEIPAGDDPSIEDLGRRTRRIEITGYFADDGADAEMAALELACETPGPGVLVMPAQGPLAVRALKVKRRRDRDKMGYFAFEAEFVRESGFFGALGAPASFLAQGAFDAVAALTAAAPAFLNLSVRL